MMRTQRFTFVLTATEKQVLQQLSENEDLPAAAIVRRLIRLEAERCGFKPIVPERPSPEVREAAQ